MRRWLFLVGAILASGTISAWQLNSRTLAERVGDADVIVVGSISSIHSRAPSPIAGAGDVWSVSLKMSRTLKGRLPADARVSFADVAVEDRPAFTPSDERVWLLKTSADPRLFTAPASYESVLLASQEARIRPLLQPVPASGAPTRP